GPLRALSFRTPTPDTEKLFMDSFNATLERYRSLVASERNRQARPADVNLDVGRPTTAGMYRIADATYAKLVDELSGRGFSGVPRELRENILNFYKEAVPTASAKNEKDRLKLEHQLELLRGTEAAVPVPFVR